VGKIIFDRNSELAITVGITYDGIDAEEALDTESVSVEWGNLNGGVGHRHYYGTKESIQVYGSLQYCGLSCQRKHRSERAYNFSEIDPGRSKICGATAI